MNAKRIFLTGFMGSGKSSVGPKLAERLNFEFIDLDAYIERKEGLTIPLIFERKGEHYFREVEAHRLAEVIENENTIISLGGGTIVSDRNLKMIKEKGVLIYLRYTPENIYHRIKQNLNRPLFRDLVEVKASKGEFIRRITSMLNERKRYYEDSNIIIDADALSINKISQEIIKKLENYLYGKN